MKNADSKKRNWLLLPGIALLLICTIAVCISFIVYIKKPEVPVEIGYRESLIGEGYVAIFENTSEKYISARVTVTNNTLGLKEVMAVSIPANGQTELGWMEGWTFVSGEQITVEHEGYRRKTTRIP